MPRASLRDRAEVFFYSAIESLLTALPLAWTQRILAGAARCFFAIRPKTVRWALANLRIAYPDLPERKRRAIGRASFVLLALNAFDWMCSRCWSDEEVLQHFTLDGRENLDKAMAEGKGALMLTLHMANWEIGVQVLSLAFRDYRPAVLGRSMSNTLLYQRFVGTRTRAGGELFDRRNAGARVLRALHEGRLVAMLLDQYSRRSRGVFVPLFGVRCSTSAGMATFAVRTGSPVVPTYIVREGPQHYRAVFLPALRVPVTGDRKRDVAVATAHYNAALEEIIRRHPEQWMWGHRRFRHSPDLPSDDPYDA